VAKGPTKRALLRAWLSERRPGCVSEQHLDEIRGALGRVSDSHLRRLLIDEAVPLAPLVAGVRQGSFDELEGSLTALAGEYEQAVAQADLQGARKVRSMVIQAKDRARWAARRAEAKGDTGRSGEKQEMAAWILTWLENPGIFAQWVALRRKKAFGTAISSHPPRQAAGPAGHETEGDR
jgi:hypothetical protein